MIRIFYLNMHMKISTQRFTAIASILFAVALLVRLIGLATLPSILNPDEAAIAYTAYLLSETGMDEWGRTWPITLQSFGDYKLIGYPTIVAFLFKLFGPSEFLVRLPAAIAGTSLVFLGVRWSKLLKQSSILQLVTAFLFACTPIFIFYSRMAFEATVALSLLITALLLWFRTDIYKRMALYDVVGIIFFVASCVTYNTPLLLLPFICFAIVWWRGLLNWKSWLLLVSLLITVGFIFFTVLQAATTQKSAITIFSDPGQLELANTFSQRVPSQIASFAKAPVYYVLKILENITRSIGLSFLVIRGGGHPWHALPLHGHLTLPEYLLALLGLVLSVLILVKALVKNGVKFISEPLALRTFGSKILLIFFTISGLAPAVVTVDAPHATRSLLFLFCLVLLAGIGFEYMLELVHSRTVWIHRKLHIIPWFVCIALLLSFVQYIMAYFFWFPNNHPQQLQTGFNTAVQTVALEFPDEEVAIVDPHGTLYILVSWYLRYSPEYFYATIHKQQPTIIGFRYGERVGQFHFIAELSDRTTEAAALYFNGREWIIAP